MTHSDFARAYDDAHTHGLPPLAVDRKRVIHAPAFRRLQYKTQVFVARQGDHYRSRLTHTLEVANLARSIAQRLHINAELAEVVALAHDLGHPPFGHAGERALDECIRRHTAGERGFEHNDHSLRVVEYLEHPYPEFRGLNLTAAVRRCLRTHRTKFDRADESAREPAPLESQVVAQADYLTFTFHDLQDGIHAAMVAPEDIEALELWSLSYTGPKPATVESIRRHLRPTVERMQSLLVEDLFASLAARSHHPDADAVLSASVNGEALVAPLDALLRDRVYNHAEVVRMDQTARQTVTEVFDTYIADTSRLPARFASRVDHEPIVTIVTDYVAGMTDRFCEAEKERLNEPSQQNCPKHAGRWIAVLHGEIVGVGETATAAAEQAEAKHAGEEYILEAVDPEPDRI